VALKTGVRSSRPRVVAIGTPVPPFKKRKRPT
jgi:hypothetical protein